MRRQKEKSHVKLAQQQYAAFRQTCMDNKALEDPLETARGPGYVNPPNSPTMRPLSLYKVDRCTNGDMMSQVPTDAMYNIDHGIAYESKYKGNAIPLKSASPRFPESSRPIPGPGSYHTEMHSGAFPTLLKSITPSDAYSDQLRKREQLKRLMGISSPPCVKPSATSATDHAMPTRPPKKTLHKSTGRRVESNVHELQLGDAIVSSISPNSVCCTSPLMARLTPKNAYNGSFVKTMISTPKYRHAPSPGRKTQYITDGDTDSVFTISGTNIGGKENDQSEITSIANKTSISVTSEVVTKVGNLTDHVLVNPEPL